MAAAPATWQAAGPKQSPILHTRQSARVLTAGLCNFFSVNWLKVIPSN